MIVIKIILRNIEIIRVYYTTSNINIYIYTCIYISFKVIYKICYVDIDTIILLLIITDISLINI